MKEYQLEIHPECNPKAVVQGDCYRFTILTPCLIRLEYNEKGQFEDRATQSVINRDFTPPAFDVKETEESLTIRTEKLEIWYNKKEFTPNGLIIRLHNGKTWYFGEYCHDLGGTARTLDLADGNMLLNREVYYKGQAPTEDRATEKVPIEPGVMSRYGFSVFDDSASMILKEDGWIAPREKGIIDQYFFGYEHRYLECLKDFYHLCGKMPLLPKYALGNWWSRFHRYTADEYQTLMERFASEKIPFSVAVIDMDWHLTEDVDPKYGGGWTGYTWNKKLFPDPEKFMAWLHEHGLKVTLNVHPCDGIRPFEEPYARVAKALGVDPDKDISIAFDPTDPEFMEVYLKVLHHPMEEEGVDFWWIDWQQGTLTKLEGLDALWVLNHYHYLDSKWKGKRAITFSRYAGVGSHRYPIGFSGDTVISWESLDFQPYFTSTASNVGYGWWSHDIGGHMLGERDDELTARWIQLGVFSPINRLHSTDNPFNGKEPWNYDKITEDVMKKYLRLRHSMIPYLYTMNRRAAREDIPLILPLYYLEPDCRAAYEVPNEYYFGSELLVSPITERQDMTAMAGKAKTWLPEGLWADFFTGTVYTGGRMLEMWRGIEEIPVLMKAGAIVPMRNFDVSDNSMENPEAMELHVFPAADGKFTLWEDAGDTQEDADENWASTELSFCKEKGLFTVGKTEGNLDVIPKRRSWKVIFTGAAERIPEVRIDGEAVQAEVSYDRKTAKLYVEVGMTEVQREIQILFADGLPTAENDLTGKVYDLLKKAHIGYTEKAVILDTVEKQGVRAMGVLTSMEIDKAVLAELCEILTA